MNFINYFNKHYIEIEINMIEIVEIDIYKNLLYLTFIAAYKKSIANNE